MHNLAMAVPEFELARHPAPRPDRQAALDPLVIGEEKHEQNVAGLVLDQHAIRAFRARRRPVLDDGRLDHHQRIERRLGDLRPVAPVNDASWKMEQEIDHARPGRGAAEQPVEQLAGLGADAGQARGRGEERVQNRWAHGVGF